jgi:hypothetical protein
MYNSMNQVSSKLDDNVTNAMKELSIKSPIIQKNCSPRCARIGWGSFGMYNSSSFHISNLSKSSLAAQQINDEEPKTPMGKRTLSSPPNTPKRKQCD